MASVHRFAGVPAVNVVNGLLWVPLWVYLCGKKNTRPNSTAVDPAAETLLTCIQFDLLLTKTILPSRRFLAMCLCLMKF